MGTHFNTYSHAYPYPHTHSKPPSYTYTNADSISYAESDSQASSYATSSPDSAMILHSILDQFLRRLTESVRRDLSVVVTTMLRALPADSWPG
jgi:hypothetical protein